MTGDTDDAEEVMHEVAKHVSLRDTHPNLFRSLLSVAVTEIALAVSYFTRVPTFNPLPRFVIGSIFLGLGVGLAIVLTAYRRLVLVRIFTAVSLFVMGAWGCLNLKQGIEGKASYALPILLIGLAGQILPSLLEPWINPITANGNGKHLNGEPE